MLGLSLTDVAKAAKDPAKVLVPELKNYRHCGSFANLCYLGLFARTRPWAGPKYLALKVPVRHDCHTFRAKMPAVAQAVAEKKDPDFVPLQYVDQALVVKRSVLQPGVLMPYYHGARPIGDCVERFARTASGRRRLFRIAKKVVSVSHKFERWDWALGDFDLWNLITDGGRVWQIDLDNLSCSATSHFPTVEEGKRHFQSPQPGTMREKDRFSAWISVLSLLLCAAAGRAAKKLYAGLHQEDKSVLFQEADFQSPEDSYALAVLERQRVAPQIHPLVRLTREIFEAHLEDIPHVSVPKSLSPKHISQWVDAHVE